MSSLKFCIDVHGAQMMYLNELGCLVTLPVASPAGQQEMIGINFCTDVHGAQMMCPRDFDCPLMAPPTSQTLLLCFRRKTYKNNHIPIMLSCSLCLLVIMQMLAC